MVRCYLIIQPNPDTTLGYTRVSDHKQCFHIKFGDGEPGPTYHRANANYKLETNDNAPSNQIPTHLAGSKKPEPRQPGKYLEQHLLKIASSPTSPLPYQNTEWHTLILRPHANITELRQLLQQALASFRAYNTWRPDPDPRRQPQNDRNLETTMARLCWYDEADPTGCVAEIQ